MIFLIFSLGLGLRLISLNQSFWLDETTQVWASKLPLDQFFNQFLPKDFNPPLYYLVTRYWLQLFGSSEIAIRTTSVLFGMLSIFILFLILNKLRVTSYVLRVALMLFATAPLHIYYSQEARMYSLVVCTFLLAVWRLMIYLENQTWFNSGLFGLSLILMIFSHYLTLLALPVFVFYLWRKKVLFKRETSLTATIIILAGIWYWPIFKNQLNIGASISSGTNYWSQVIGSASLKSAALLPVKFVIGRISIQPKWLYAAVAFILVVIYWGSAGLTLIKKLKYKYLFFGLLIFPPVAGLLISFWLPVFSYFRFLYLLPILYLLIGLSPIPKRFKVLMIILNLIFSGVYLVNPRCHRENWRGLAQWLNQKGQPPVYILNQVRLPLEYYYEGKIYSLKANVEKRWGKSVYLVSYGLPIFDREDKIREKLEAKSYQLKTGESFRKVGIEVWRK